MPSLPTLRKRPTPASEAAQRLAALDDWTKAPAAEVATVVTPEGEGQGAPVASNAPTVEVPEPSAPKRAKMPWHGLEGRTQAYHVVLPADLYMKMRWLASQDLSSTMRKEVLQALNQYVDAKIKEYGHDRDDDDAA